MMQKKNLYKIELPTVPQVALKLHSMLNDTNINLQKIEEIILADQSLTAKILKIANSAFYGLRKKVHLVSEAINVLGFNTLRNILLIATIKSIRLDREKNMGAWSRCIIGLWYSHRFCTPNKKR